MFDSKCNRGVHATKNAAMIGICHEWLEPPIAIPRSDVIYMLACSPRIRIEIFKLITARDIDKFN